MTTGKKTPKLGTNAYKVHQRIQRLGLSESQAASYLGVPVPTLRKWIAGDREPPAAVSRLIDVLTLVEVMAPAIHDSLLTK